MHLHTTGQRLSGSINVIMSLHRALIICLLALALPLKAMAGLVGWGCGPGHHGAAHHGLHASAVDPGRLVSAWALAAPSDNATAHHHAAASQATLASVADDGADSRDDPPRESGASAERCSACTPCGVALAPAPDAAGSPDHLLRAVLHAPRDEVHADPVVDVPLEPPRPSLI